MDVLRPLRESQQILLQDKAFLEDRYLTALGGMLPAGHPLLISPEIALDLLYVILRAALAAQPPEEAEAECQACGERCAAAGLPDDSYTAVGRAVARAARDVVGDAWNSTMSSGWAAVHLWVLEQFSLGASLGRARGERWRSFPALAPSHATPPGGPALAPGSSDRYLVPGSHPPPPPSTGHSANYSASSGSVWEALEQTAGTRPLNLPETDQPAPEAASRSGVPAEQAPQSPPAFERRMRPRRPAQKQGGFFDELAGAFGLPTDTPGDL